MSEDIELCLGPKGPMPSVLHQQLEIGINDPLEKKSGTGESYQVLRSTRVGRLPHPEFEFCQNYPAHLTEAKVLETLKRMGAGSEQEKPQARPLYSAEVKCKTGAGTGTDEESQRIASRLNVSA